MAECFAKTVSSFIVLAVVVQEVSSARIFDVTTVPVDHVYAKAGENVSLSCPGLNELVLVLSLEWKCSGCNNREGVDKLIQYQSETITNWGDDKRVNLHPTTYALSFHPVMSSDSAEYMCLLNSRPNPEAKVKLLVQDVPDPPGRPLIITYTSRAANLSWAPSFNVHNSPVSQYIIIKRMGEEGEWDTENSVSSPGNETTYQITDLKPFTVYSFKVIAVNEFGPSKAGKPSYYMVTLREAPDGKPTITAAHNTSSTSIRLDWRPPPKDTINGELLGYKISYRPRDKKPAFMKQVKILDPNAKGFTIKDLETFTQYLVSLQVFNPEGPGPSTTVVVMTDEGVPSSPQNMTVLGINDTTVELSWIQPSQPSGIIQGYRLYFIYQNFTDVKTIRNPMVHTAYVLESLKPYTEYKIFAKAFTWKNDGESSDPVVIRTDVSGPSSPVIVNLTCQSSDTLLLQWTRPEIYYGSIDFYYIYYRREDMWEFKQLPVETDTQKNHITMLLPNLTVGTMYEVKVQGGAKSLYANKVYKGKMSEPRKIILQPNCQFIRQNLAVIAEDVFPELGAGVIAGIICATFAIFLFCVGLLVWRKFFHASYYCLEEAPANLIKTPVDWDEEVVEGVKTALPLHVFPVHVASLHADGDIGFSKEYEALQVACPPEELPADLSQHPDNKSKNRYMNIVAYDHSRVSLKPLPGQKKIIEYVNANYIDGYQKPHAYIATQGPLPSTFDTFWRMIWEQKVYVVVMITNLVERGRKKCDQYWPKEGVETYGTIQVKFEKETVLATYTIRQFGIQHIKLKCKKHANCQRRIYQYHYTNWPDHGTPEHPLPILSFVRKSAAQNPSEGGPIVVHCSAGVGRTGTYIVLDAVLRQVHQKGTLSIFSFLKHIRNQRNFLVQTEEQYIFIHDALLEAILSGDTDVNSSYLSRYILGLQCSDANSEQGYPWQLLENQHNLVTSYIPKDYEIQAGLMECNRQKNRFLDMLPIDSSRVCLTPKPGVEGSDYINATWLVGYHKLSEFIITQHPLENTICDFWQMIWDHNAQTVVVLSDANEMEFITFWPLKNVDFDYANFKVVFLEEKFYNNYILREFTLQSLQDDYQLTVKMIHQSNWPPISSSMAGVFDLVQYVQKSNYNYQNGPLVIVDNYGGTEAATFCCLTSLYKQWQFENHLDVYMYAKLYHLRRPFIWRTKNDYLFLYRAVESLINNHSSKPDLLRNDCDNHKECDCDAPPNGHVVHMNGYASVNTEVTPMVTSCERVPPDGMETAPICDNIS